MHVCRWQRSTTLLCLKKTVFIEDISLLILSMVTNAALYPLTSLSSPLVVELCAKALHSTEGPIVPLAFSETLH